MLSISSPRQLFKQISWTDFIHWRALYELQPWGEHRQDMRSASLYWAMLAPWTEDKSALGTLTPMYPYFEDRDAPIAGLLEQTNNYYEVLAAENGIR